jgi:hypothetical protein
MRFTKPDLLILVIAFISAALFMAPFCGVIFKCGCSWLWTTAATQCNVHHSSPPHCPWCSHGKMGYYLPFVGLVVAQALTGVLLLRRTHQLFLSILATLAALVPTGLLMGALTLIFIDYPLFILT